MRWWPVSFVIGVVLAGATVLHAVAAPAAAAQRPVAVAQAHGHAVVPVPGAVLRQFLPPATRYGAGHRGVDLAAAAGEPVVAAMGGIVSFAAPVAGVGWVTVDHGGGLNTTYGPIDPRAVRAGQRVAAGTLLGFLAGGSTHLDWGARLEGEYLDPLTLLGRWEAYLTSEMADDRALLAAAQDLEATTAPAVPPGSRRFVQPAQGPVTSTFGPRRHPVTGEHRHHAGLDIGAPTGAPVLAAEDGVVTFAGDASGYGRTVIVDHGGGVTTLYAHLSSIGVRVGQAVDAGTRVGAVGATGQVTGPHLHFEVRVGGVAQDPSRWL